MLFSLLRLRRRCLGVTEYSNFGFPNVYELYGYGQINFNIDGCVSYYLVTVKDEVGEFVKVDGCPSCDNTGVEDEWVECQVCEGEGKVVSGTEEVVITPKKL